MNNDATIYKIEDCGHTFHTKCILEMYIKKTADTCPLCRHIITTKSTKTLKACSNIQLNLFRRNNTSKLNQNLFKKYDNYEKKR